jgi:hypothetical protein
MTTIEYSDTTGSVTRSRRTGSVGGGKHPASRRSTQYFTVFGEQPANSAAARNVFVRSNASRISMISSRDFNGSSPSTGWLAPPVDEGGAPNGWTPARPPPSTAQVHDRQRSVPWPPPRGLVATSVQNLMAADIRAL